MKLARAVSGGVCLLFGFACSSPAPEPARGAVSAVIGTNNTGSQCIMSGPLQEIPNNAPGGVVNHNVTCNPTQAGCEPTANMAVDGKGGASVQCSVKQSGSGFDVNVSASIPNLMNFSGSGVLTTTGGTNFHVFIQNYVQARSGSDSTCTVDVKAISPGRVLASYNCQSFDVPNVAGAPGCTAVGGFVFDNCDS